MCYMANDTQDQCAGWAAHAKGGGSGTWLCNREQDRSDVQRLVGEEATPFIYCSVSCQRVNWVTLLLAPAGA